MILPFNNTYDPYSGIIIEGDMINVSSGHYPFIEGQKFTRKGLKLRVVEFIFDNESWARFGKNCIKKVRFETIEANKKVFDTDILQVLESLKAGRTKFSL